MIQIYLRLTTPVGQTEAIARGLNSVMLWARMDPAGPRCQVWSSVADPGVLCLTEDWPSVEDLERYICDQGFTRLLALMELASEQPDLEFRFVSETRGLDYVSAVRARMSARGSP